MSNGKDTKTPADPASAPEVMGPRGRYDDSDDCIDPPLRNFMCISNGFEGFGGHEKGFEKEEGEVDD